MGVWSKLVQASSKKSYQAFVNDTRNPELAQKRAWERIWKEIHDSSFWRERVGSSQTPSLDKFEITTYETYRNTIEKSYQSGISELSGKPVLFWCESSGSTGKRKLFPVTRAYQKEFQSITAPQSYLLCRRFPRFLEKPFLFFVAVEPSEFSPTGIPVGFISHYNYKNIPKPLRRNYGFPIELFENSETFDQWSALYAIAQDLSAMAAITPSMLQQLGRRISNQMDLYWPYLEGKPLPKHLPKLNISRSRLKLIKNVLGNLKSNEVFRFKELWPSLQLVICWKSSTCGLQLPGLEEYLQGEVPVIEGGYCATEGWMTVPLSIEKTGTVLHPGSHVVEFLPLGKEPIPSHILKPWELIEGKEYEIVLTTSMGFVRYRLFDIIRCKGYFNQSPLIEFTSKSGNQVSIGQVRFNEEALLKAIESTQFNHPGKWVFGPNSSGNSLVFYTHEHTEGLESRLLQVQEKICHLNGDYGLDLKTGLMGPLRPILVSKDHPWWSDEGHAQRKPKILTDQYTH